MSFLYAIEAAEVNIQEAMSQKQAADANAAMVTSAAAILIMQDVKKTLDYDITQMKANVNNPQEQNVWQSQYQRDNQAGSNEEQIAQNVTQSTQEMTQSDASNMQNDVQFATVVNDMMSYLSSQLQSGY